MTRPSDLVPRTRRPRALGRIAGLVVVLCAAASPARAQNGPDQSQRTMIDVGKGLGACAAQQASGCLTFGLQLLTGKVGAESDAQRTLDKLDSVNARLDGIHTSLDRLGGALAAGITDLSNDVNDVAIGTAMGLIAPQISAIDTYLADFKLAAEACLGARRQSTPSLRAACGRDTTKLRQDLDVVFDGRDVINQQLLGNGVASNALLLRLWRHNARPKFQGAGLAASTQATYDYYAGVQATQLALVAMYENLASGVDTTRKDAIPVVKAEIQTLGANLDRQKKLIGSPPAQYSFIDQSVANVPVQWLLEVPANFVDAYSWVSKSGGLFRLPKVADINNLLAGWDPNTSTAAVYVARMMLGANVGTGEVNRVAAMMDVVWTDTQPDVGNGAAGDYLIGCTGQTTAQCDNNVYVHKEDYQRVLATLGPAGQSRSAVLSRISWATTFDCTPPHFDPDRPLEVGWVTDPMGPCSWWKYKGVTGADPNIAVYVTPNVHPFFLIFTGYDNTKANVLPPP